MRNEAGYERDRLTGLPGEIRWWLYLQIPSGRGRNQLARKGVVDRGWRFARGGRCTTEEEAAELLSLAREEAVREFQHWQGQPSHALDPHGELIPLDEVVPELTR